MFLIFLVTLHLKIDSYARNNKYYGIQTGFEG